MLIEPELVGLPSPDVLAVGSAEGAAALSCITSLHLPRKSQAVGMVPAKSYQGQQYDLQLAC